MVNPFSNFSIYNRIYKYKAKFIVDRNIVKGDKCILMRVQINKPYHDDNCHGCVWWEEIEIEDIMFKIPDEMLYNYKYKSIINNISRDNFPLWFEKWFEPLNKCIGYGDCGYQFKKIVYIPIGFTFIPSYEE